MRTIYPGFITGYGIYDRISELPNKNPNNCKNNDNGDNKKISNNGAANQRGKRRRGNMRQAGSTISDSYIILYFQKKKIIIKNKNKMDVCSQMDVSDAAVNRDRISQTQLERGGIIQPRMMGWADYIRVS